MKSHIIGDNFNNFCIGKHTCWRNKITIDLLYKKHLNFVNCVSAYIESGKIAKKKEGHTMSSKNTLAATILFPISV